MNRAVAPPALEQAVTSNAAIEKDEKDAAGISTFPARRDSCRHMWEVCPGGRLSYLPRGLPR